VRELGPGSPLEIRVAVVESDEGYRQSVVQVIEKFSSRFEVVVEADSHDQAASLIANNEINLLVIGSANSTESPDSAVDIALARVSHDTWGAATILLSKQPASPEFVRDVAAENVIAYVRRTSILCDSETEAGLLMALSQFASTNLPSLSGVPPSAAGLDGDRALICVDYKSNKVVDANAVAYDLFGLDDFDLSRENWWKVLGFASERENPLNVAVGAGVDAALPPTLLRASNGSEILLNGNIKADLLPGQKLSRLDLRKVSLPDLTDLVAQVGESDTVAVLGVDRFRYSPGWCVYDTDRYVMDIRTSLLEIARAEDVVSIPRGHSIIIILHGVGIERSSEIGRAFLSHIKSIPDYYSDGVGDVRHSLGLAQRTPGTAALAAIIAANNAMLCSQIHTATDRMKLAERQDLNRLLGLNYLSSGAICEASGRAAFLAQLSSLNRTSERAEEFIEAIIRLILGQAGVSRVTMYRRHRKGGFHYMAGGVKTDRGVEIPVESEVSDEAVEPGVEFSGREIAYLNRNHSVLQPLSFRQTNLGYIVLEYESSVKAGFYLCAGSLHFLAANLPGLKERPDTPDLPAPDSVPTPRPLDTEIDGYVVDNMEGAVDQATFLSKLDMPVAIIGPRGTGKMYIARIVHQESGGAEGMLEQVNCHDFRNRDEAISAIGSALAASEGKTLVFKSPHLMAPEVQTKLAKQLSTRTLADVRPSRYLPRAKYVALFPEPLEKLVKHAGLSERLASVFAGYPINVPPVKDRKQAVLRWAHKILGQESVVRGINVKGFTPDAELAMLSHDWSGNISEMRHCISQALEGGDKEWLTPVDLGIFKGISLEASPPSVDSQPFLSASNSVSTLEDDYTPSVFENLELALAEAVNALEQDAGLALLPLGAWLEDELVLAVLDRYGGDVRRSADFMHIKPRNIGRWMPKISERMQEREASTIWSEPRRTLLEWVRETALPAESPLLQLQNILLLQVSNQLSSTPTADKARIMGVSVPTYQKRLRDA